MNSALRTRAKLSVNQVVQIFQLKKNLSAQSAAQVARDFEVSEKTVRDIWAGRTWSSETCHLDSTRILKHKQIGRPKGCRDSKPRKNKGQPNTSKIRQPPTDQQLEPEDTKLHAHEPAQMQLASSNSAPKLEFDEEESDGGSDGRGISHPPSRSAASAVRSRSAASAAPSSSGESVDQQLFEWELASRFPAPRPAHRPSPHRMARRPGPPPPPGRS